MGRMTYRDPSTPVWCNTCGIHLAKPDKGICPVCLDQQEKR